MMRFFAVLVVVALLSGCYDEELVSPVRPEGGDVRYTTILQHHEVKQQGRWLYVMGLVEVRDYATGESWLIYEGSESMVLLRHTP